MNENTEVQVMAILNNIRDNLLKPMAAEIVRMEKANSAEILTVLADSNIALMEKLNALQTELMELKAAKNSFEERIIQAASEVKWNE